MVSDFFEDYYRQKAVHICAPFIFPEWLCVRKSYMCNYFSVEPDELISDNISRTEDIFTDSENSATVSGINNGFNSKIGEVRNPTTLFTICLENLQKHLFVMETNNAKSLPKFVEETANLDNAYQPKTLFSLCMMHLTKMMPTNLEQVPSSEIGDQVLYDIKGSMFQLTSTKHNVESTSHNECLPLSLLKNLC